MQLTDSSMDSSFVSQPDDILRTHPRSIFKPVSGHEDTKNIGTVTGWEADPSQITAVRTVYLG